MHMKITERLVIDMKKWKSGVSITVDKISAGEASEYHSEHLGSVDDELDPLGQRGISRNTRLHVSLQYRTILVIGAGLGLIPVIDWIL